MLKNCSPIKELYIGTKTFCKGTFVCKIIVGAKVDTRAVLLKKSADFSLMPVTESLLHFGCFAAE